MNITKILEDHQKWVKTGIGKRANLRNADLINVDLSGTNLEYADLSGSVIIGSDLRGADLKRADISSADLSGADLSSADLSRADLSRADLSRADLSGADLRGADLSGACLRGADLRGTKINELTSFFTLQCPKEGAFVGYKKASGKIVKLLITEDALRSSATSSKCRASKAKVLDIEGGIDEVASDYDKNFIYKVGETVEVKDFDMDRWNECSTGIHFFIYEELARQY